MAIQKDFKNQNVGLVVLLILLFLVGFGIVSLYQTQKTTDTTGKVLPKTAKLSIVSDKKTVSAGESFTVKLLLDSGNQAVEAADFTLTFDPKYLQVKNVAPGSYFKSYPVNKTEEDTVKISAVAYFDGSSVIIPKGRGDVASITFSAVTPVAKTSINIDPVKTAIASKGQNILAANKITDFSLRVRK